VRERKKKKILILEEQIKQGPMHQDMLGAGQLESTLAEKNAGVVVNRKLYMSQPCALATKRRLMVSWTALGGVLPADQGK